LNKIFTRAVIRSLYDIFYKNVVAFLNLLDFSHYYSYNKLKIGLIYLPKNLSSIIYKAAQQKEKPAN